jgi:low molecular weight protein-tyrosine phosphatase
LTGSELTVAFVCTGNRFRSPLAAALLADEARDVPIRIASLGTLELGPEPALPEAITIAESLGLDLSEHRARSIAGVELGRFDLVLGFERKHVATSVIEGGAQSERTFTLPELVELLRSLLGQPLPTDPVERSRVRIRQADAVRPPAYRPVPEVPDPLGLTEPQQLETARELEFLVGRLARGLFD